MVCRVHLIAAARPNFMKIAPLYHALADISVDTSRRPMTTIAAELADRLRQGDPAPTGSRQQEESSS